MTTLATRIHHEKRIKAKERKIFERTFHYQSNKEEYAPHTYNKRFDHISPKGYDKTDRRERIEYVQRVSKRDTERLIKAEQKGIDREVYALLDWHREFRE